MEDAVILFKPVDYSFIYLLIVCCIGTFDFQNNKVFVASIEARMVCASATVEYNSSRAHIISLHSFIRYTYPYIHSSHLLVSIDLHHLLPSFSPQNHHTHALRKHITNVSILKEDANILIVDGVEDKVSKSGNGGLEFHIIILLER